jgi:hypothetical protein
MVKSAAHLFADQEKGNNAGGDGEFQTRIPKSAIRNSQSAFPFVD